MKVTTNEVVTTSHIVITKNMFLQGGNSYYMKVTTNEGSNYKACGDYYEYVPTRR